MNKQDEFYGQFTIRTRNGLKKNGIDSLLKLQEMDFPDFIHTRGIGIICVREVWNILHNHGLKPAISNDESGDDFILSLYKLYPDAVYLGYEAAKIKRKRLGANLKKQKKKPNDCIYIDALGDGLKIRAGDPKSGKRYIRIGHAVFDRPRKIREMAKKMLAIADWVQL
jgi:hypothetical protein